jgi:hypothetical protein
LRSFIAIGLGALSSATAPQTVEDLKRELAAKNADVLRLKNRVQLLQARAFYTADCVRPRTTRNSAFGSKLAEKRPAAKPPGTKLKATHIHILERQNEAKTRSFVASARKRSAAKLFESENYLRVTLAAHLLNSIRNRLSL